MKKVIMCMASMAICLLAVLLIGNTTYAASKTVKVTELKVTNIDSINFYSMRVSGTLQIKTSISPQNAANKNITWSSSDKTIASVNRKGFVTGISRGFCKITGITKDGSNKKVSFYIRVYSEKEFVCSYGWDYDQGSYGCKLYLSPTGEYSKADISAGEEIERGSYTLDVVNKTITFYKNHNTDNTKKIWNYKIVTRSKLVLSDGTTQVTYTRNYKNTTIRCTGTGLLYVPNGPDQAIILRYAGTDTTLTIPSRINKREVTWVRGISENTQLEQVIIPDSVTQIDGFKNCTNLKKVTIPDRVTFLDYSAFENCVSLETIKLPSELTAIREQTFKGCNSLKSIELPEQITRVGSEAFCNCVNLESLYFPKGIKEIESDILKGCNQVVIYGYKDTCAEDFAKENNLTFIER